MPKLLLLYSSQEGQTRTIAAFVRDLAQDAGWTVDLRDVAKPGALPVDADAVLVAASVHVGKHAPAVQRLVLDNHAAWAALPTAFISVSLSAGNDRVIAAEGYANDFLGQTGWQPARQLQVGGALRYRSYGLLKRMLMRQLARSQGLPTDTSRDYEYTDWARVEAFIADFLTLVPLRGQTTGAV